MEKAQISQHIATIIEEEETRPQLPLLLSPEQKPDDESTHIQPLESEPIDIIEGEITDPPPVPLAKKHIPLWVGISVLVSLLLVTALSVSLLYPVLFARATVIITPHTHAVDTTAEIAVTPIRIFKNLSHTMTKTIPTTGHGHQDATKAHGLITLYNALQSIQVIPAGTLLISSSGIHIVTDSDAIIPAGNLVTNGQVTIPAHATISGPAGNIQPGAINGPCCREYVFARNTSSFSGGQNERDYQAVAKEDISTTIQTLSTHIDTTIATSFQSTLSPDEALTPPDCSQITKTNHHAGEEATSITITLTKTCTIASYRSTELTQYAKALLRMHLSSQFGTQYRLADPIQPTIPKVTITPQFLVFTVKIAGEAVYQFQPQELAQMKYAISGTKRDQAMLVLLHHKGVRQVIIAIANGGDSLPTDTTRIQISTSR